MPFCPPFHMLYHVCCSASTRPTVRHTADLSAASNATHARRARYFARQRIVRCFTPAAARRTCFPAARRRGVADARPAEDAHARPRRRQHYCAISDFTRARTSHGSLHSMPAIFIARYASADASAAHDYAIFASEEDSKDSFMSVTSR